MKTVLFIRHAKSSWEDFGVPDFERPLNERGKRDAPDMAKRLLEKKISIDAFISSPAKRAKKTAALFAKEYASAKQKILLVPGLYHASDGDFYQAIQHAPAKAKVIAVFSHNPGISEFVNKLTGQRVDDMPTCSVFAVQADVDHWSDFESAEKVFLFFDYPKRG